ncbi:hypothetical protein lerEdw1_005785 [Lerista edwardsae]|nr:hypothetical protein lerEdw1_005785 [Lerista edwardsae]
MQIFRASEILFSFTGILFAATTFGPAVAFLLGAVTLRFYVDINRIPVGELAELLSEIGITHKDPRWVGAWWLGFLISASMVAIAAIPYFFFPRALAKQEEPQNTITVETVTQEDIIEDMHAKSHEQQDLSLTQFLKICQSNRRPDTTCSPERLSYPDSALRPGLPSPLQADAGDPELHGASPHGCRVRLASESLEDQWKQRRGEGPAEPGLTSG